jgi:hypothetical protein
MLYNELKSSSQPGHKYMLFCNTGCDELDPVLDARRARNCCSSFARVYFHWMAHWHVLNVADLGHLGDMARGNIKGNLL